MSKCPDCDVVLAELERVRADRDRAVAALQAYERDTLLRLEDLERRLRRQNNDLP